MDPRLYLPYCQRHLLSLFLAAVTPGMHWCSAVPACRAIVRSVEDDRPYNPVSQEVTNIVLNIVQSHSTELLLNKAIRLVPGADPRCEKSSRARLHTVG